MKKILFTILISSFAFGQLLNNSEKEVIPVKKDSDIIRQVGESLISPMIILDPAKSRFVWNGGLKFGPKTHNGKLRLSLIHI